MEILNLSLSATNQFATDYLAQNESIGSFFHYNFLQSSEYEKRLLDLHKRTFMRDELADYIEKFMSRFPGSNHVKESLRKLKQENSVVVIGGQQAGLLTGPLYSIHKVISIITLAKKQEKALGIPVVPVFWIAGEDHDYQEVNHVYIEKNEQVLKYTYPEKIRGKKMVSDIELNKETCHSWIESIIETFGETQYTNELVDFCKQALDHSHTFVDFFAHIIMELFKDEGLLLVDSGDIELRKLEKEYFIKQIENTRQITELVKAQQKMLEQSGFPNTIEISNKAGNLFYYDEKYHERILLEFDDTSGNFVGKNGLEFSIKEMKDLALEYPERLSNNVVTRPLMQEWLFPTLAFIAGPGEISYWAELKMAFEYFELFMPPIVPRLNITFLERSIESEISHLNLTIDKVLIDGVEKNRQDFLCSIKNESLASIFDNTRRQLQENYDRIEEFAHHEDKGLLPLIQKNEQLLLEHIQFMQNKLELSVQSKHEVVLRKYTAIENALKPLGSPQERIWNIFYYLNQFGFHFINDVLKLPFEFDGTHKVIKM